MKVLVTGGTGIIGRYLLRKIKDHVEPITTYFKNTKFKRIQDIEYHNLDVTKEKEVINLYIDGKKF